MFPQKTFFKRRNFCASHMAICHSPSYCWNLAFSENSTHLMQCKYAAWIYAGEHKGKILGKNDMVIVLMLLHLSMMSPVQWKAKHNTRANFKCSFLIRKAFKGYVVSPCCGCSQIPFKITRKRRKHPHKICKVESPTETCRQLCCQFWA